MLMKIGLARQAATEWVRMHARKEKGYLGAYFSGSTVGRLDQDTLPVGSDVDVVVVRDGQEPPPKLGKLIFQNTLIEVTYISSGQLDSAEQVLRSYHLAGSFRTDTLIDDPTGRLRQLQQQVSQHFNESRWIVHRCMEARNRTESGLRSLNVGAPLHELAMSWLFPTGVMTHVVLVAALRNPTVRLRYLKAREVLEGYGLADIHQELLGFLGCADWTAKQTEHHLLGLEETFDAAAKFAHTEFFFSSDITPQARPIAIDGSRVLIQEGNHREAVFWIAATYARCLHILAVDAPEEHQRLRSLFENLLADLGITAKQDFIQRGQAALDYMPKLWDTAERIMNANPEIVQHNETDEFL